MYSRRLQREFLKAKKSVLLLGPRQTGKSTLIKSLDPDFSINFADEQTFVDFARDPSALRNLFTRKKFKKIFIDEVQRLPSVLNTIQTIIDEDKSVQFFLTGSSARKLKRGSANLLPGRIHSYRLGGLTLGEKGGNFDLKQSLETGSLPGIYSEDDIELRKKDLRSYTATYLREEIQAEALTKNIEGFSRFIDVAAANAGNILDLSKLSSAAQVPRETVSRFFDILNDTLIVYTCEPYSKSSSVRLRQHPKYYFFDNGVLNGLLGNFEASADRIGILFEHLVAQELIHNCYALDKDFRLSYFRTSGNAEVDFIFEYEKEKYAIEVKASRNVGKNDLRGFQSLKEVFPKEKFKKIVVYMGAHPLQIGDVDVLPFADLANRILD